MTPIDLNLWASRLQTAAERTLGQDFARGGEPALREFTDERGNRRPVDLLLVARVLGVAPPPKMTLESAELALWRIVSDVDQDVGGLLAPDSGAGAPLLHHAEGTVIEAWTEAELCALHALWAIGSEQRGQTHQSRCLRTATWHVEHTQPDNATARPWAIHVFLIHATRTGSPESAMYAETMLHNCLVGSGYPDRVSAVILMDAAAALRAAR